MGAPFVEDQLPPGGRGPLTPGLSSVGLAPLACNEMPCPAERGSRGKGALLRDVGCVREQEWGRQQEAEAGLPGACWDAAEMGEALRGVGGALRREPGTWGGWGEAGRGTVASLSPQTTSVLSYAHALSGLIKPPGAKCYLYDCLGQLRLS